MAESVAGGLPAGRGTVGLARRESGGGVRGGFERVASESGLGSAGGGVADLGG